MADIFINYRRLDAGLYARSLRDRLVSRFGREQVFLDVTETEGGAKYEEVIGSELAAARVQLVLIGPHWTTITDSAGRRRLLNENDLVRSEIARALQRDIRVIPVLLPGAELPTGSDLPTDIQPLLKRHAVRLSSDNWDADVERLVTNHIGKVVAPVGPSSQPSAETDIPTDRRPDRRRLVLRWIAKSIRFVIRGALVYGYFFVALAVMFGLTFADDVPNWRWLILIAFGIVWGLLTWVPYASSLGVRSKASRQQCGLIVCSWALAWGLVTHVIWSHSSVWVHFVTMLLIGLTGSLGTVVALRQRWATADAKLRREFGLVSLIWTATLGGFYLMMSDRSNSSTPGEAAFGAAWVSFVCGSLAISGLTHCWRAQQTTVSVMKSWVATVRSWE